MKSNEEFYKNLAQRESGGLKDPYSAVNKQGYIGKYQLGEAALKDAGYYEKKNGNYYSNDWSGKFTGKDGVYSKDDFLKNKQAQENAIKEYMGRQWDYLAPVHDSVGKVVGENVITPSGLIAAAHLVGQNEVIKYIKSDGEYVPKDGNGVPVTEYIHDMGHCEVLKETKNCRYDTNAAEDTQATLDNYYGNAESLKDWAGRALNGVMWDKFKDETMTKMFPNQNKTINSSHCSGSYPVSGYTRSDGSKVDSYVRNCWKH